MAPKRALGYIRLSVHRGEVDPSTSPASQEEKIRAYCQAQGWSVADVVKDIDVSGSDKGLRLDRPGLTEVRARFPDVDVVIFSKLDRLARNVLDFNLFAEDAKRHGVALVSVAEALDLSTPMGRFAAQILASFAEMEAATIAERVRGSVDYLRRNDRFPGMRVPFGYRPAPHPSGAGRVLEIDPENAARVREAAERVLAGEALYAVAQDFTARGVPTSRGGTSWSRQTLRGVLLGDAVLGRVTVHGEPLRDEHGLPRGVWPPILTLDESRRLRALFPASGEPARPRAARLLSGLAVCGSCGSRLHVQRRHTPRKLRGKDYLQPSSYRCAARSSGGTCESPVTIAADRLEEHVVEEFLFAWGRLPVTRYETLAPEPVGLAEVEEALQHIAQALTAPGADVAALVERLNALRARRDEIAALPAEPELRAVETGRTFAEEWAAYADDLTARRGLLAQAFAAVIVHPASSRTWDADRIEFQMPS